MFVGLGWLTGMSYFAALRPPLVLAALVAIPVVSITVFQKQFFLALHEYRLAKLTAALSQILPLVAYVGLVLAGRLEMKTVIGAYITAQLLCFLVADVLVRRLEPRRTSYSFDFGVQSLKFGIQQYLSDIAYFLMGRLDFILVARLLGTTGLGIYSVAVGLAEIPSRIPYELGTVLFQPSQEA